MPQQDTRQLILDVAEKLFAREGFHRTSLRALTREAGVNLAAVNYHFGSKEALLKEVFARRLQPLNAEREQGLHKLRQDAGHALSVEAVLRVFLAPVLRFHAGSDGPHPFALLVGRTIAEDDKTIRDIFMHHMRPVFSQTFELLCEALPQLPRDLVHSRFMFTIGAMSRGMCLSGHSPMVPEGVHPAGDSGELLSRLLVFATAGMEAA